MASAFGTNTPNYSSSDLTNNRRMLTNYNYVKKIVTDQNNKESYCLNSSNGNVILKPVELGCGDDNKKFEINETGNIRGDSKKLGFVNSYQLLSDITKGFYSPLCYRKSKGGEYIYTDAQSICCDTEGPSMPNIDGDMQFGLYYTEFSLDSGQRLIKDISSNNQLKWAGTPPDVDGIKDGLGQYIIDPEFLLFSTKECCNNYVKQLNSNYLNITSQFNNTDKLVYGSKANPDLFKIQYNSPIYFKGSG
jgi:hypothetical protein